MGKNVQHIENMLSMCAVGWEVAGFGVCSYGFHILMHPSSENVTIKF